MISTEKNKCPLALYAQTNRTQGRQHPEAEDPQRNPFQRDRNRIIHTTAFRRLQGKTQVVSPDYGDHFRNRLTHTIEVSLTSRDIARQLNVNEDLCESIALAHDLGHPPFGHAGEDALHKKMKSVGLTFDHNKQSLRMVDIFESRYFGFRGINLTKEVREGIEKHENIFFTKTNERIYFPHIESQVVDIADEITYLCSDIEDGLLGNFFSVSDLLTLPLMKNIINDLPVTQREHRSSIIRNTMRILLQYLIEGTLSHIKTHNIRTQTDVQKHPHHIVQFQDSIRTEFLHIKQFLYQQYYTHPDIEGRNQSGIEKLNAIFDFLVRNPSSIPHNFIHEEKNDYIRIGDYIAGMTDRFALQFYTQNIAQ